MEQGWTRTQLRSPEEPKPMKVTSSYRQGTVLLLMVARFTIIDRQAIRQAADLLCLKSAFSNQHLASCSIKTADVEKSEFPSSVLRSTLADLSGSLHARAPRTARFLGIEHRCAKPKSSPTCIGRLRRRTWQKTVLSRRCQLKASGEAWEGG